IQAATRAPVEGPAHGRCAQELQVGKQWSKTDARVEETEAQESAVGCARRVATDCGVRIGSIIVPGGSRILDQKPRPSTNIPEVCEAGVDSPGMNRVGVLCCAHSKTVTALENVLGKVAEIAYSPCTLSPTEQHFAADACAPVLAVVVVLLE